MKKNPNKDEKNGEVLQVYAIRNTFNFPGSYPPPFRPVTIGLIVDKQPTRKEEEEFDRQLKAHSGYQSALENPVEMIRLVTELFPKMKPLTPYEYEIIEHYIQLHKDISLCIQLHKDVLAQIPVLQDKFKQAHEVIPQIIREFDKVLNDARLVQNPEDKNEMLAGYRKELLEKYEETCLPFQQKINDASESMMQWHATLKEYEASARKISVDVTFLQTFYVELYQNYQRFTLSTGVFTEDFNPFMEQLNQQYRYWQQQHTVVTDFIKEFKALEKACEDMQEYINKTGPRGLKKRWGN